MSKPAIFTQGDISKLLKGARAAGVTVATIEIDRAGRIVARLAGSGQNGADAVATSGDEWGDRIRARNERLAGKRH